MDLNHKDSVLGEIPGQYQFLWQAVFNSADCINSADRSAKASLIWLSLQYEKTAALFKE
jgi:hypothetical protein